MVFDGNLLRQSIFVQLRQDRPPAIFLRSEFSANERRLAVQNSVSVFVTSRVFSGQPSEPFSPPITRTSVVKNSGSDLRILGAFSPTVLEQFE